MRTYKCHEVAPPKLLHRSFTEVSMEPGVYRFGLAPGDDGRRLISLGGKVVLYYNKFSRILEPAIHYNSDSFIQTDERVIFEIK